MDSLPTIVYKSFVLEASFGLARWNLCWNSSRRHQTGPINYKYIPSTTDIISSAP